MKFLHGHLKIGKHKVPKLVLIGMLGVIFMFVGAAGSQSMAAKWWIGKGDMPQHVDYVWRVYNGDIPRNSDRIQYPPFVTMLKRDHKFRANQPAASNPPLFYIIQAPFIGPSLNLGKWQQAVAIGRAVNIFIGVLCIIVLAWAGWLIGGKDKELFAVSVPAIATLTYRFTSLNLDFALDGLLALISTLTLIVLYKIIQHGLTKKYIFTLLLLLTLGMLTKVPFAVFLFIAPIIIILRSLWLTTKEVRLKTKTILIATIVLIAPIICSIWFYYLWNYKHGGGLFTSNAPHTNLSRQYKSVRYLVLGKDFWELVYSKYSILPTTSTAIASFSVAGVLSRNLKVKQLVDDKKILLVIILMSLAYIGTLAVQFKFAIGYGAINFRYLLPAILPIGLFLSYGLLAFRNTRGLLVALAAILMGYNSIIYATRETVLTNKTYSFLPGFVNKITSAASSNGIPSILTLLVLSLFLLGSMLLIFSLWQMHNKVGKRA